MLFTQVFASALPLSDNFGSNDFSSFRHHSGDGDELPRTTGKLILDLLNIAGEFHPITCLSISFQLLSFCNPKTNSTL